MSEPSKQLFTSAYCVHSIPDFHKRDTIVVQPLICKTWKRNELPPFAAIFVVDPGQVVYKIPILCVHVYMHNEQMYFADGAIGFEKEAQLIHSDVEFPPLAKALRHKAKAWGPLLKTKANEKPYLHLKNWHNGDIELQLPPLTEGPSMALELLKCWGQMERERSPWKIRMIEIYGERRLGANAMSAAINKFQKFCNGLGLNLNTDQDHSKPLESLYANIKQALAVSDRGNGLDRSASGALIDSDAENS